MGTKVLSDEGKVDGFENSFQGDNVGKDVNPTVIVGTKDNGVPYWNMVKDIEVMSGDLSGVPYDANSINIKVP